MSVTGSPGIRRERPEDIPEIRAIHERAFGRPDEADLVDRLRRDQVVLGSFVAVIAGQIVGHILFSRMSIETAGESIPAVALAPVSVLPHQQRAGIGASLIRHGLQSLRATGERIVLVLGEPAYYSRFGFSAEQASHLTSTFPQQFYMALELAPAALTGVCGKVRYPAAFGL